MIQSLSTISIICFSLCFSLRLSNVSHLNFNNISLERTSHRYVFPVITLAALL